ncbi:hypothetical protein ZIOFF_035564 [Zingiber officinale]|uniref:Ycf2 N-terminal domain-containing protein n=1 Tax=Zingiber officinale TaxID=94328 RepID=A0A8J5G9E4_ZINOF|nr:hypothetical protein ZIOFF_035564 [Zingiber officinale]
MKERRPERSFNSARKTRTERRSEAGLSQYDLSRELRSGAIDGVARLSERGFVKRQAKKPLLLQSAAFPFQSVAQSLQASNSFKACETKSLQTPNQRENVAQPRRSSFKLTKDRERRRAASLFESSAPKRKLILQQAYLAPKEYASARLRRPEMTCGRDRSCRATGTEPADHALEDRDRNYANCPPSPLRPRSRTFPYSSESQTTSPIAVNLKPKSGRPTLQGLSPKEDHGRDHRPTPHPCPCRGQELYVSLPYLPWELEVTFFLPLPSVCQASRVPVKSELAQEKTRIKGARLLMSTILMGPSENDGATWRGLNPRVLIRQLHTKRSSDCKANTIKVKEGAGNGSGLLPKKGLKRTANVLTSFSLVPALPLTHGLKIGSQIGMNSDFLALPGQGIFSRFGEGVSSLGRSVRLGRSEIHIYELKGPNDQLRNQLLESIDAQLITRQERRPLILIFPDRVMILIEQEIGIEEDKEQLAGLVHDTALLKLSRAELKRVRGSRSEAGVSEKRTGSSVRAKASSSEKGEMHKDDIHSTLQGLQNCTRKQEALLGPVTQNSSHYSSLREAFMLLFCGALLYSVGFSTHLHLLLRAIYGQSTFTSSKLSGPDVEERDLDPCSTAIIGISARFERMKLGSVRNLLIQLLGAEGQNQSALARSTSTIPFGGVVHVPFNSQVKVLQGFLFNPYGRSRSSKSESLSPENEGDSRLVAIHDCGVITTRLSEAQSGQPLLAERDLCNLARFDQTLIGMGEDEESVFSASLVRPGYTKRNGPREEFRARMHSIWALSLLIAIALLLEEIWFTQLDCIGLGTSGMARRITEPINLPMVELSLSLGALAYLQLTGIDPVKSKGLADLGRDPHSAYSLSLLD